MEEFNIKDFKEIFNNDLFKLPVRWDGKDFLLKLNEIYKIYCESMSSLSCHNDSVRSLAVEVKYICNELIKSVRTYLNGKPTEAFGYFDKLFNQTLMANQFSIYNTFYDPSILENKTRYGRSKLFRVRKVGENKDYLRKDIFHTPFNLRNKVGTTRYSIAGYPSLYLSSSLELCLKEMNYEINPGRYICSRFEMVNESKIRIIELGIKPSDFYIESKESKRYSSIDKSLLSNEKTIRNYYLWFPLIVACSFMRTNRNDPFAIEYVVPQLLMQSIRTFTLNDVFMGIRYFSCASMYSSDLGFNYVLPTNYDGIESTFCPVLSKAFLLTKPIFLNEYKEISHCETALRNGTTDSVDK